MEDHIENQQQVLQILKDNLTMAQNRMNNKQINIVVKEVLK